MTTGHLDPTRTHPMVMPDGTAIRQVVHLNRVIDHPRIEVGDFSFLHCFDAVEDWAAQNWAQALAPYLFPLSPERLVIGRFAQIAHGVRIITSSANHDMSGFSTYPFRNFLMSAETTADDIRAMFDVPGKKGDTVIGNDVWIGMGATIMPGVTVGDGAIISARAVVAKDVPPYGIVGGNPAALLRRRFDDETVAALLAIRWWDWPAEKIQANIGTITGTDIGALRALAERA